MSTVLVPDEAERLRVLDSYAILDTPREEGFDQLARLAANVCGCPMAVVNFLDSERQWFKAAVGVPFDHTDRALSFCTHAISGVPRPLVIPDTAQHPDCAGNPMVVGPPHVRFYACAPLVTPDGHALGTIAVLDTVPRTLSGEQLEALKILGDQAMAQLELRRQRMLLAQLAQERNQMHREVLAQSEALRVTGQIARVGGWTIELPGMLLNWSQEIASTYRLAQSTSPVDEVLMLYAEPHRSHIRAALDACLSDRTGSASGCAPPGWPRAMPRARSSASRVRCRTSRRSTSPASPAA